MLLQTGRVPEIMTLFSIKGRVMARSCWLRWGSTFTSAALLAAGCSSSSPSTSTTSIRAGASSSTPGTVKLPASARGVTADTINVGVAYIDLAALAKSGLVKADWGPVEDIARALVDDVNAQGGINGRKLRVSFGKYLPIGNAQSLAACTKLTEDDRVFVVLGGFLTDNNLCVVQQNATALVSAFGLNNDRRAKAKAPWVSIAASDEHAVQALVDLLGANGDLRGRTFGIYSTAASKSLGVLARDILKAAGATVADVAVQDAALDDPQARGTQDKLIAQRMMDARVDSVINVDNFQPLADFDSAGFYPRYYAPFADAIVTSLGTNPWQKFPFLGGTVQTVVPDANYNSPGFTHCRDVWKRASGKDILTSAQENKAGKSTGNSGMGWVCEALQIFVDAARAAGPNLNNDTLAKALASLGTIQPDFGAPASLGAAKPDAQQQFVLAQINPAWTDTSDVPQLLAIGQPITKS